MTDHEGSPQQSLILFNQRFHDLAMEAKSYGVVSIVALAVVDPLSQTESATYDWCGSHLMCYALAIEAKDRLREIARGRRD